MKKIIVETSARHIHVTQEVLEKLCGKDAKLEVKAMLSQPGQFCSTTKLSVVGPKNTINGVSILGPCRKSNQVEVSATDARTLGVPAVVRESGDIAGTPGIKIVGPAGEVELSEGVIVAKRHIHMTPADAKEFGVENGQIVKVATGGEGRKVVFDDVVIRVREDFALAMHIDTDESNAGLCGMKCEGEIIK